MDLVRLDDMINERQDMTLSSSHPEGTSVDQFRSQLREIVLNHPGVLIRLKTPVQLASGDLSSEFVDGKLAVDEPENLQLAGAAMLAVASEAGIEFDAVGGLVVGAAPFTFAVAQVAKKRWFLVRKEPKGRGTNLWIEGARLHSGMNVMIVDDVVTRGGSIRKACELVEEVGAKVVIATTLVDRGDFASIYFEQRGIPYHPILTYRDLDIEPVGGLQHAQAV